MVVQQAAAGLVDYLLKAEPDAATRGVIIGYDARRKSDAFALDTARVCAARGVRAMIFPHVVPTPLLAWNIVGVGAAAGVVVTASHNPPADNGYKVFTADGAQIVSPVDAEIAACIDMVDPCDVPLSEPDDPLIEWLDDSYVQAYLAAVPAVRLRPELAGVPVAYSAMHGVGGDTLVAAFDRVRIARRRSSSPSSSSPIRRSRRSSFPNPEEPGAMDLLLAEAAACEAAIALCNDPDADRLGAAIPTPDGGWRRLQGDEIGWLLADHILQHTSGDDRLVITTLVSSSLLSKMAAEYGVQFAETYTGLQVDRSHRADASRVAFRVRLRAGARVSRLRATARQGRHHRGGAARRGRRARQSRRCDAAGPSRRDQRALRQARDGRPVGEDAAGRRARRPSLGCALLRRPWSDDRAVSEVEWFDEAGLLRLQLGPELRLQLRPSGTEPKVKLYGEGIDIDPAPYLDISRRPALTRWADAPEATASDAGSRTGGRRRRRGRGR